MKSKVVYTEETDFMEDAAEEILDGFKDFALQSNSLAIVFAEDVVDYPELYRHLSSEWDFPVIGCTALGMIMSGGNGFENSGITVMVMTGDECRFAAGLAESLTPENYEATIRDCYRKLSDEIGGYEKIVLAYGTCVTENNQVSGDDMIRAVDEASGHKPIFGGLASDNLNFKKMSVFYNDRAVQNGEVIALIGGDVKPIYRHINSVKRMPSGIKHKITKSEANIVYELDGEPIVDVLTRDNFDLKNGDVLGDYLTNPFIITIEEPDGSCIEAARNLSYVDLEKNCGVFFGFMPEGATFEFGYADREYVKETLNEVMYGMLDIVKNTDYPYRTVLCTSCASRYLVMSTQIKDVAGGYVPELPEDNGFLGFYSYGEFCPVSMSDGSREYNMFHNFTYVLMAI